ncbi:MAG: FAD-binding protein [Solirubrobacteraceae bacterium]
MMVRPAATQQVAAVMALCTRHGAAVVPQGGSTGLVDGGFHGEARWLSLQRLNAVEVVNAAPVRMPVSISAPPVAGILHKLDVGIPLDTSTAF